LLRLSRACVESAGETNQAQLAEASLYARLACQFAPENSAVWRFYAQVGSTGDQRRAVTELHSLLNRNPENLELWNVIGLFLARLNRLEEALDACDRVLSTSETNTVAARNLWSAALQNHTAWLRLQGKTAEAATDNLRLLRIPARAASAPPNLIDLSGFYNAKLNQPLPPERNADLALSYLEPGIRTLGGTDFDVRGIILLCSSGFPTEAYDWPRIAPGIPIAQKCRRLHFLHAARWGNLPRDRGVRIASYRIHFGEGQVHEIPVKYGEDLAGFFPRTSPARTNHTARVVWTGSSPLTSNIERLFEMIWDNPAPESEITSIDFVSAMGRAAPFLVAITADPVPETLAARSAPGVEPDHKASMLKSPH
jgi:tetratricopeptide (TPR) repeat protein